MIHTKLAANNLMTLSAPLELYYCAESRLVQLNIEVDKKVLISKNLSLHKQYNQNIKGELFSHLRKEIDRNKYLEKK